MKKETFVLAIEAIEKQIKQDIEVSETLHKVFPEAVQCTLLPDNHHIHNALMAVLQEVMDDNGPDKSWIEFYFFDLDFGKESYRVKATNENGNIALSNAAELYICLMQNQKKCKNT